MEKKGRVTIPTDAGFFEETKQIIKKWGADAVRDCDGTSLPENIKDLDAKVYSTYFVIRGDNEWAKKNLDELQFVYLLSDRVTADGDTVEIPFMDGYFAEQVKPDYNNDPKKNWEVIDRTADRVVDVADWSFDKKSDKVLIRNAEAGHEYTVTFFARSIWDPVQMYNYLTNNWDREKQMMYDPRYPKTGEYIVRHMEEWLESHKEVDVVRFTTFLYQFTLIFNDRKKEKYVDWFGYSMSVSPKAMDDFQKAYGYRLRPEDIVDKGYYNNPFRVPSKRYLDYMDFIQKFVTEKAGQLVSLTHGHGKEAMMFLGDCWIGAEPYGKYFPQIGLDAVVGSVGGGVTVRMLTDIPDVPYKEGRFLPYFFPDTFYKGNDPTAELNKNWLTARRAMMRKPLDRIGYGGYLKLAAEFPDFIERVGEICEEFRTLYGNAKDAEPYCALRVGVLNCWGKIRSWQAFMVAHELWYRQIYSYQGILESLSGMQVDVDFINFDDIENGALDGIDVIINAGAAGTAFSGGENWGKEKTVSIIRNFVRKGGGFIGVGEPSAYLKGGRFFQLADVMGVEKETGLSLSEDKYNLQKQEKHFITEDIKGSIDYGESIQNIFALKGAAVLDIDLSDRIKRSVNAGEVKLAANDCGKGKGVYIAGLPFSLQNSRLLYRALLYAAGKQDELYRCFSTDINTDCHYYENKGIYALVNHSNDIIKTDFYDINGIKKSLELKPMEIRWIKQ